jgi:hypothetical protein
LVCYSNSRLNSLRPVGAHGHAPLRDAGGEIYN